NGFVLALNSSLINLLQIILNDFASKITSFPDIWLETRPRLKFFTSWKKITTFRSAVSRELLNIESCSWAQIIAHLIGFIKCVFHLNHRRHTLEVIRLK